MGGTSAAPLWSPLDLPVPPTIVCDHLSVMENSGGLVTKFNDRAGANNYFTGVNSPVYVASAVNGYPAVRGTGSDTKQLNNPSSTGAWGTYNNASQGWLFCIYKLNGTSGTTSRIPIFVSTNVNTTTRLAIFSDGTTGAGTPVMFVRRLDADSAVSIVGPSAINDGNFHMLMAWMNWGTREGRLYIDGNSPTVNTTLTPIAGNTSATDSAAIRMVSHGGSSSIDGDIAAGVFGTTLPSDADVDRIFGYYAHQFALTANLPSGHPYKTSPP